MTATSDAVDLLLRARDDLARLGVIAEDGMEAGKPLCLEGLLGSLAGEQDLPNVESCAWVTTGIATIGGCPICAEACPTWRYLDSWENQELAVPIREALRATCPDGRKWEDGKQSHWKKRAAQWSPFLMNDRLVEDLGEFAAADRIVQWLDDAATYLKGQP